MEEVKNEQNTFVPKVTINVAEERKKPRLEIILFCEYASKSQADAPVFAGCFDRLLYSKGDEKVTSSFYLYVQTGETRGGDLQIAVFSPKDELHFAVSFELEGERDYSSKYPMQVKLLQRLQFPVPFEGNYWFDVSCDGESLGGRALIVEFEKEAQEDEHNSREAEKRS